MNEVVDSTWIRSMDQYNFLAIYDVMLDIEIEVNISPEDIEIPLFQQRVRFPFLIPIDSIGTRDAYCDRRWKAIEFLKKQGVVREFAYREAGHRWESTIQIILDPDAFVRVLKLLKEEYESRNSEPQKVDEVTTTPESVQSLRHSEFLSHPITASVLAGLILFILLGAGVSSIWWWKYTLGFRDYISRAYHGPPIVVFAPRDIEIDVAKAYRDWLIPVKVDVAVKNGKVVLLPKAEIISQEFKREWFAETPHIGVDIASVNLNDVILGLGIEKSSIELVFRRDSLVPLASQLNQLEEGERVAVGTITVRMLYVDGSKTKTQDANIQVYLYRYRMPTFDY
jgi:hypothetical protein